MAQSTVAGISAALDILENEPERVQRLRDNVVYMQDELEKMGFRILRGKAGIIPVFLPDGVTQKFNYELYRRGLFLNTMEFPMVPPGLERLRISMMATHTKEQMDKALSIIKEVAELLNVL
jgi:glycine C-acetyltransferase